MYLVKAVSNILEKEVTEDEAKDFALNQYGVLATYIRNEYIKNLSKERKQLRTPRVLGSKSKKYQK